MFEFVKVGKVKAQGMTNELDEGILAAIALYRLTGEDVYYPVKEHKGISYICVKDNVWGGMTITGLNRLFDILGYIYTASGLR